MEKHPEDLKEEGNEALRAGNYSVAIDRYTAALEAVSSDKQTHVYYGNRAIAYMKQEKFAKAVEDATAAIGEKRDYAKAYLTKGNALEELGRREDALAAWRAGVEAVPSDATLKDYVKRAEARAAAAAAAPPAGSGTGTRPAASARAAPTGTSTGTAPSAATASIMLTCVSYLRLLMLVCLVTYLLPLGLPTAYSWWGYTGASAVTHLLLVVNDVGMPAMNQEYLNRVLHCVWAPLTISSLFFTAARPTIFGFVAVGGVDLLAALDFVYARVKRVAPLAPVAAAMGRGASWVLPYLVAAPASEVSGWTLKRKWDAANVSTLRLSALCEIIIAIMLIGELLTPNRSILVTFMLWQLLQLKFSLSEYTRGAFAQVHGRISGLTQHRLCPALIATGYAKLAAFLRSQVKTPEEMEAAARAQAEGGADGAAAAAGAGGGISGMLSGAMSKCTIQ